MKKNQKAPRPSERPPVRGEKMSNDISTDVQNISTITRSSGLQYSSESCGGKQKHLENDGHLNKHLLVFGECCLKKNQNAPRSSERPPVRGENMSNDISTDVQYI